MLDKIDELGIPKDFLRDNALGLYFGRDWPADVFETLDELLRGESFDAYEVDGQALRTIGESLDLGNAQLLASDNVARPTVIVGKLPIYIYVTDDNDVYTICAPRDFLRTMIRDVKARGHITDTERLTAHPHLLQGRLPEYFEEYREFNVELAGQT